MKDHRDRSSDHILTQPQYIVLRRHSRQVLSSIFVSSDCHSVCHEVDVDVLTRRVFQTYKNKASSVSVWSRETYINAYPSCSDTLPGTS